MLKGGWPHSLLVRTRTPLPLPLCCKHANRSKTQQYFIIIFLTCIRLQQCNSLTSVSRTVLRKRWTSISLCSPLLSWAHTENVRPLVATDTAVKATISPLSFIVKLESLRVKCDLVSQPATLTERNRDKKRKRKSMGEMRKRLRREGGYKSKMPNNSSCNLNCKTVKRLHK